MAWRNSQPYLEMMMSAGIDNTWPDHMFFLPRENTSPVRDLPGTEVWNQIAWPDSEEVFSEPAVSATMSTTSMGSGARVLVSEDMPVDANLLQDRNTYEDRCYIEDNSDASSQVHSMSTQSCSEPRLINGKLNLPSRGISLEEKRRRESEMFPKEMLKDLKGTTSSQVRNMTEDQRALVLYKRKLRNRMSARLSRDRRRNRQSFKRSSPQQLLPVSGVNSI